ncbi:hypothetical protein CRUP_025439 [Coryphaenoides rupestris]|nr:hypothetical protein CRUP_025439 [Coryphaenoides rupestris]
MNNMSLVEPRQEVAYAAVFGCVVLLGLPLNVVSLWILLRRHRLKSPSAVLMINLAWSDLLLVVSLPTKIYFYATGSWPFSAQTCVWITMLFRNNTRTSIIFITFISVDRVLAVVFPLRQDWESLQGSARTVTVARHGNSRLPRQQLLPCSFSPEERATA